MNRSLVSIFAAILLVVVAGQKSETQILSKKECELSTNEICLPKSYDKHTIPSKPTNVGVEIFVAQISEVDDDLSTVDILASLTFTWEDHRLMKLNSTKFDNGTWKKLNHSWKPKLWVPDIHVMGMKDIKISSFMQPYTCKLKLLSLYCL